MKIKVKQSSFDLIDSIPRYKHQKPIKQSKALSIPSKIASCVSLSESEAIALYTTLNKILTTFKTK